MGMFVIKKKKLWISAKNKEELLSVLYSLAEDWFEKDLYEKVVLIKEKKSANGYTVKLHLLEEVK